MYFSNIWWVDFILMLVFLFLFIKEGTKDSSESIKNIFRVCIVSGGLVNAYFSIKEIIQTGNREIWLIIMAVLSVVLVIIYGTKLIVSYNNKKNSIVE